MRKGQAALEFLTTYGWAFLVILVMIGALAYFGVLNPSGLLPSRCTFSPELQCLEHEIIGDNNGAAAGGGEVKFRVRNNVGSMASFTFNATEVSTSTETTCSVTGGSTDIKAGRIMEVVCQYTVAPAQTTFAVGDKIKFEIEANYTKAGGSYSNPVLGEIYGEAK